jgi:FMN phosphatase YigB (HAD superfamily)
VPQLVLFDLDNTLVDRAGGLRRWVRTFCDERGLGPEDVEWMVRADGDGLVPKEVFFGKVADRFRLPDSVPDLFADYRTRKPAMVAAYPGAHAGLARLREADRRVGLVTNGLGDVQLSTMTCSGIADLVDGWAISGVEGVRKPDPRIFEIAAGRCGTTLAAGGWMVGDSATADIGGGRAAGLRTIWIDHGRPWPSAVAEPDHVTADVTEAIAFLLAQ